MLNNIWSRFSKKSKNEYENLFHLIKKKEFDLFRQIIDSKKLDPNMRDITGNTLLIHACEDDDKLIFTNYLIMKGADVNAVDKKGMSALFKACYWGETETVKALLKKKEICKDEVNQVFNFSLNPLSAAIFKNHLEITKLLLNHGADPLIAEKIILENIGVFKDSYTDEYQKLIDNGKRWHKGKKQLLFALKFAKKNTAASKLETKSKAFDITLLPKCAVLDIAQNYL